MDEQRRQADGDEHRQRPIAGGKGKGHELALVAELGEEDDSEGEKEGVHGGSVPVMGSGPGGTPFDPTPGMVSTSKVSSVRNADPATGRHRASMSINR
jgi:hypothetical protein